MRGKRTIAALSLLLVFTGCSSGSNEADASKGDGKGDGQTTSRSGSEKAAEEPEPLMFGTQRYVSPCRLLPPEDVARVYGDPGKYANFRQETREKSISTAEMRAISQTVGGAVSTRCSYSYDDRAESSIYLEVDQYASPRLALKAWKRIKKLGTGLESRRLAQQSAPEWLRQMAAENEASMGGAPAKGLDPSILFVPGRTNFVGVRGNLLVTVQRKSYAGSVFEGNQVKGTLASTRKAFRLIYRNADDTSLDQSPVPPWWEQEEGWPRFLDPCAVFDDEAMVASSGRHTEKFETDSVLRDPDTRIARNSKPAWKAVHNECNRTARQERRVLDDYWHGDLELWYAAPGDTGRELLEGFVVRNLIDEKAQDKYRLRHLLAAKVLREVEVEGAESAYLFDYRKGGDRYGWIVGNVGPYLFQLDVTRSKRKGFGTIPMSQDRLVVGAEHVAANIRAQVGDEIEEADSAEPSDDSSPAGDG
jgi:hypothetical protein